jgi:Protein of unknown function (DUF3267).
VENKQKELPEVEVVLPAGEANLYAFVVFAAALALFAVPFIALWGFAAVVNGLINFLTSWSLLMVVPVGMAVHELLHAVVFAAFCKRGFASISFGMKWKYLSPWVHCKEALPLNAYRLGTLMPGLATGIVPAVVALITGNAWLLSFGLFFTAGAASDFHSLLKLVGTDDQYEVCDHPDEAGFILRQRT